jgi:uncharacterized protein YoxC
MERIVVNKHYNDSSLITPDKFKNQGEIAISNEYGFEGIYIINTNGDVVKIGYNGGSSSSGSTSGSTPSGDYVDKTFLKDYLRAQAYMTSAQTEAYVYELERALSELSSGFTAHKAQNVEDYNALIERIDNLSGVTAEVVTDEHIRELASQEIAKIVDSADTRFDTLREIADWIINDSTGAPELANDVARLKNAVSGLSSDIADAKDDISTLESNVRLLNNSTTENLNKINSVSGAVVNHGEGLYMLADVVSEVSSDVHELSASTEAIKDFVEAHSADTSTLEALKAYIDEQIRNISRNGDHVFLSRAEYDELVANGRAVISGETFYYSDYIYYCIYDDGNTYTGTTGGSIVYTISGDVIDIENVVVDENGFVSLDAPITEDGFIDLDAAVVPIVDDSDIVVNENGVVENQYSASETNEGLFIEMPAGTQWII